MHTPHTHSTYMIHENGKRKEILKVNGLSRGCFDRLSAVRAACRGPNQMPQDRWKQISVDIDLVI